MAMATCDHLDEGTLESRVRMWRPAIEYCFKKSDVVTKLAQHGLLNAEENSRLIELYDQKPSQDAAREMLNILFKKRVPERKWTTFVDAIKEAGYDFVVSRLIHETVEIAEERERGKQLLLMFGPFLENDDPLLLIPRLLDRRIIKQEDADKIVNTTHTKSKAEGMRILLQRIQCYLEPHKWWEAFLIVLWETEFEHIALLLEPEYHPTSKKLGPIYESDGTICPVDMQEHVLEDQVDAEPDNDLNAPPRSYSLRSFEDTDTVYTRHTSAAITSNADDINDNFKELNIKPERIKSVDDAASASNENCNEWDSENGGSDFEENDENQGAFGDEDTLYTRQASTAMTKGLNERLKRSYEPRDYQLELAEKAIRGQNTIILAETGTGKTWVALHVIEKHLQQASKGTRTVAFMARTGILIKQQSNRLKKFLPRHNTKLITGDDEDSRMVDAFIPTSDIICFTPQILVNNLDSGNISSLSKFSLLVFDECHHTRGDDPYASLARRYLIEKGRGQKDLPQIVGLTASIGVGRSRSVEETVDYILRVCASLDVRPPLSTVERCRESFMKWVNTPEEETIKMIVKNPDPCKDILLAAMEDAETLLEEMMFFQPAMIDMLDKRPGEKDNQAYNKWTMDIEKSAQQNVNDHQISRDISACAVYLNVYNSAIEVSNLLQVAQVARYIADKQKRESEGRQKHTDTEKKLFEHLTEVQRKLLKLRNDTDAANPNVLIVSAQLQKMIQEKGEDSRAIVFVKARATCRALAEFLDNDLKKIGVKASPLYGQQPKGADEGMTESVQTEILKKFRDGFFKVMVCTSVGAEGIDVPDCNIVLNYNYSGDEITKIQMKGRGRKIGATVVVMGDDKLLEQEMVNAYKADMMYKAVGELKKLSAQDVEYKIKMFQQEEMQKHRYKTEYEKAKKNRRGDDDLEIMCNRCNTIACLVSDVRKFKGQHFVIAKEFSSKVNITPHKCPKKYDGIEKKGKMHCKKCPLDWGIVAVRKGLELFILKLECLKMRNMRTGVISQHKKWLDVPYEVPEVGLDDLPTLFGNEAETSTSAN